MGYGFLRGLGEGMQKMGAGMAAREAAEAEEAKEARRDERRHGYRVEESDISHGHRMEEINRDDELTRRREAARRLHERGLEDLRSKHRIGEAQAEERIRREGSKWDREQDQGRYTTEEHGKGGLIQRDTITGETKSVVSPTKPADPYAHGTVETAGGQSPYTVNKQTGEIKVHGAASDYQPGPSGLTWDQAMERAQREADEKAGFFSSDATDFPSTSGSRERWIYERAMQIFQGDGASAGNAATTGGPAPVPHRGTADGIPPAAIKALTDNPNRATEFDEKYGAGAAQKVLGGG